MRIGGAYVGLGLGDSSDEIRRLKSHLRRKFGYASALADTSLFDQQMVDLIVEMQRRYNAAGQLPQIAEATGMFKAMVDAVMFFGAQTGPHINYSPTAAIDYLRAA